MYNDRLNNISNLVMASQGQINKLRYSSMDMERRCADLIDLLHSPSHQPCDEQSSVLAAAIASDFEVEKSEELLQNVSDDSKMFADELSDTTYILPAIESDLTNGKTDHVEALADQVFDGNSQRNETECIFLVAIKEPILIPLSCQAYLVLTKTEQFHGNEDYFDYTLTLNCHNSPRPRECFEELRKLAINSLNRVNWRFEHYFAMYNSPWLYTGQAQYLMPLPGAVQSWLQYLGNVPTAAGFFVAELVLAIEAGQSNLLDQMFDEMPQRHCCSTDRSITVPKVGGIDLSIAVLTQHLPLVDDVGIKLDGSVSLLDILFTTALGGVIGHFVVQMAKLSTAYVVAAFGSDILIMDEITVIHKIKYLQLPFDPGVYVAHDVASFRREMCNDIRSVKHIDYPLLKSTGCIVLVEEGGSLFTFKGPERNCSIKISLGVPFTEIYWKIPTHANLGHADAFTPGDFSFVAKIGGLLNLLMIFVADSNLEASVFTVALSLLNSCAIFKSEDEDLNVVHLRKHSLIVEKSKLSKTYHILEIGFGRGSLAMEDDKQPGYQSTDLNLTEQQLKFWDLGDYLQWPNKGGVLAEHCCDCGHLFLVCP